MSTQTHVERLQNLGKNILESNICSTGFNGNTAQKLQIQCNQVGLGMMQKVTTQMDKFEQNLENLKKKTPEEKKKLLQEYLKFNGDEYPSEFDNKDMDNQIISIMEHLSVDAINGIHILLNILYKNQNLDDIFKQEIMILIMKIINKDINNSTNRIQMFEVENSKFKNTKLNDEEYNKYNTDQFWRNSSHLVFGGNRTRQQKIDLALEVAGKTILGIVETPFFIAGAAIIAAGCVILLAACIGFPPFALIPLNQYIKKKKGLYN